MQDLHALIKAVETARLAFVHTCSGLKEAQALFKPNDTSWCIAEVVEHIYWAEKVGIVGMWKTAEQIRDGAPYWTESHENEGLTIEEIVANTWKEKEQVPEVAKPRWFAPLGFWVAALESNTPLLKHLGQFLEGLDMHSIVYPHPLSGPMNVPQRLQFLRFHLNRHQGQIERIKVHPDFPNT